MNAEEAQRALGVYICLALVWKTQFEKMYEKLKDSITKLKNTTIIALLIHVYFNTYLLKVVYFGYRIIELTPK